MKSYMVSIFLVRFESILFWRIFFLFEAKPYNENSSFGKEMGEKSRDQVTGENKMNKKNSASMKPIF